MATEDLTCHSYNKLIKVAAIIANLELFERINRANRLVDKWTDISTSMMPEAKHRIKIVSQDFSDITKLSWGNSDYIRSLYSQKTSRVYTFGAYTRTEENKIYESTSNAQANSS